MSEPIEPPLVTTQSPPAGLYTTAQEFVNLLLTLGGNPTNFNVTDTIISQYANSPTLIQLTQNLAQYFDPSANFEAFYNNVWNIDTAVGFGLDIWGRIIGVGRLLTLPAMATQTFGFYTGDPSFEPFNQAPFASGEALTQTYALPDNSYRTLLLVKAFGNICSTTVPAINSMLNSLFTGRGRCYVQDNGGMVLNYVFEFALTPVEYAILTQVGVPPRPAGVLVNIFQIDFSTTFGFDGSGLQPFNQGVFFGGA